MNETREMGDALAVRYSIAIGITRRCSVSVHARCVIERQINTGAN